MDPRTWVDSVRVRLWRDVIRTGKQSHDLCNP